MSRAKSLAARFGFGGEHPDYPLSDWRDEATAGETILGYWDWVDGRLPAPMKVWWIGLYATVTVIAADEEGARAAWEDGEEFDMEIDGEGGIRWISEAEGISVEDARRIQGRLSPDAALHKIQELMNGCEWGSDVADDIAEVVRSAGYEIEDLS